MVGLWVLLRTGLMWYCCMLEDESSGTAVVTFGLVSRGTKTSQSAFCSARASRFSGSAIERGMFWVVGKSRGSGSTIRRRARVVSVMTLLHTIVSESGEYTQKNNTLSHFGFHPDIPVGSPISYSNSGWCNPTKQVMQMA